MPKFLPRLISDNKLPRVDKYGEWIGLGSIAVDELADSLEVPESGEGGKKVEKDQIFSIPDPWARVLLFTRALLHVEHPSHRRVVGEWRGLLAILALKEIRKFSELIPVPVSMDIAKMGTNRPPKESFLAMAARVRPGNKSLISKTTTWNSFHILSWRSRTGGTARAFAMTSPTTLVATGAYYAEVMDSAEVPWFRDPEFATPPPPKNGRTPDKLLLKGGVLRGPTAEDLSDDERVALAQWLLQVHTKLSAEGSGPAHSKILQLLQAFQKEMVKGLEIDELDTFEDRVLVEKRIGISSSGKSIFNFLDRPAKLEPRLVTDLMLVTSRGKKQYLVLDEGPATTFEREPRDITFYKGVSLATAERHYASDVPSGAVDEEESIFYCTKDFFFEPDLVFILKAGKQTDMLPRCLKARVDPDSHSCAQQRQILFPITEEAAKLFAPEDLAARTKVLWVSGDEAIVTLELDVRSVGNPNFEEKVDERPTRVTIRKRYVADALHAVTTLPVIGVWPNVQFPDEADVVGRDGVRRPGNRWRRYFLFESWRGGANAVDKLVLRARPLEDPDTVARMVKQGEYFRISRLSKFPEVLVCETPSEVEQQNRRDTVQGLLLPTLREEDRPPNVATKNAVLGVDFGTTGTSIYQAFYVGDGRGGKTEGAEPVLLKDRFLRITASSDEELLNLTRELFLPAKDWPAAKILSVYQDLESSEASDKNSGARLPVTHGHVLFADEKDQSSYIPEKQKDSVYSDLKWGQKEVVARAAKNFISQLCLQSVLELACQGAQSIEVRYSYPTAFNGSDVYEFVQRWQKVISEVAEVTSLEVTEGRNIKQNYEAVAAARYFRDRDHLTAEGGALTLDIGGGTTDLALWSTVQNKPTLLSHSSVLFAGRDIFLATIRKNPDLLESIRNKNRFPEPVPEFKESAEIKQGSSSFFALLDAHIQMYGDKLMGDTGERFSKDNTELKDFLRIIELGLCGIAFYAGLHWGRMISGSRVGETVDGSMQDEMAALQTASRIRVYVGGNGSKLLRWCGLGRFEEMAPIYSNFSSSLARGVDMAAPGFPPKRVEINLSGQPKQEVAYGLVMSGPDTQKSPDFTVPMAGESFILANGEQRSWSDPLDLAVLRAGAVRVGDRQKMMGPNGKMEGRLPIFSAFLDSVDERVEPDDLEDIALDVNQMLSEKHSDLLATMPKTEGEREIGNKVRNEPIFFLALQHVIRKKIDAIKSSKVKV